ncbi:hypothetical protein BpHYR1_053528 [Brachionus plicatilis]|uniref:Uncharacterized protein n=1 Tax=Brachionus plicatilis TaxID=10195 RepID=A0A3M7P952_BRAPC|nr:hypothetical protein BpHYR1_053528 [Brachionus plicatilis]
MSSSLPIYSSRSKIASTVPFIQAVRPYGLPRVYPLLIELLCTNLESGLITMSPAGKSQLVHLLIPFRDSRIIIYYRKKSHNLKSAFLKN